MRAVENHPDLKARLAKGDFQPTRNEIGQHLTVIRPKVAIECNLPLVLGEGDCRVEFSSLLLQGLTCKLDHDQILESLMIGLQTSSQWETRYFIHEAAEGIFEVQLGNTTVILNEQEARELCDCVDDICINYRDLLIEAENILETWDYPIVTLPNYELHTFSLLTVHSQLWKLMLQFGREFDFQHGESPWHIFDQRNDHFRVINKNDIGDHALIYPFYEVAHGPTEYVDILYCIEVDSLLVPRMRHSEQSWKDNVGPNGSWTAPYTERWLKERFIPHIIEYYSYQQRDSSKKPYFSSNLLAKDHIPFTQISDPNQLFSYVEEIQDWSIFYGAQISALSLRDYYATFVNLIKNIDYTSLNPDTIKYICEKLRFAEKRVNKDERNKLESTDDIINALVRHATRIQEAQYEDNLVTDVISRAFLALLNEGAFRFQQHHINSAKEAITSLLDIIRFEKRYVRKSE